VTRAGVLGEWVDGLMKNAAAHEHALIRRYTIRYEGTNDDARIRTTPVIGDAIDLHLGDETSALVLH